jgi:hypothetical protein
MLTLKIPNLLIRLFFLSLLPLLQTCQESDLSNTWKEKAYLSDFGRLDLIGFAIKNKGYVGFGTSNAEQYKDWWSYDPDRDKWTRMDDFPGEPVINGISVSSTTKGYIGLGHYRKTNANGYYYYEPCKDIWEYDPVVDNWSILTTFPGESFDSPGAFIANNNLYIVGGYKSVQRPEDDCQFYEKEVWEYDFGSDSWTQKNNIPMPQFDNCYGQLSNTVVLAISSNEKGLVVFQRYGIEAAPVWGYDPLEDKWTDENWKVTTWGRSMNIGFLIRNDFYIGDATGGQAYRYNPRHPAKGEYISRLPKAAPSCVSFTLHNKGYVVLASGKLWEYTPEFSWP